MKKIVRTRFAPSPTGDPHIGNIRTALFAYLYARHANGNFILRIEDTDKAREVPKSIDRIKEGLLWFGMQWDEGPILQSGRLPLYQKIALQLVAQGNAYYCFCSPERLTQLREEQAKEGKPPMYDKKCFAIPPEEAQVRAKTEAYVIRLQVPQTGETKVTDFLRGDITFKNNTIDDQVLLKSDGYPTYHLAVVVDDHDMAITHIIRGDEWIPSTPKHVLLYQFLQWDLPVFVHLPLIVGKDKKKLSKRTGDTSLLHYKTQGYTALSLINFLVRLGFTPKDDRKLYTLDELVAEFTIDRLHKNPAIFDVEKLNWFNRLAKEQQGDTGTTLQEAATRVLQEHGIIKTPPADSEYHFVKEAVKRADTISQVEPLLSYFWQETVTPPLETMSPVFPAAQQRAVLEAIRTSLTGITEWDEQRIGNTVRELAKATATGASKDFYQLLTMVITGSIAAPPLFASIALLGKDRVLNRINTAITRLQTGK